MVDYAMVGLWWHDESNTFNQTLETVWNKDVDFISVFYGKEYTLLSQSYVKSTPEFISIYLVFLF